MLNIRHYGAPKYIDSSVNIQRNTSLRCHRPCHPGPAAKRATNYQGNSMQTALNALMLYAYDTTLCFSCNLICQKDKA